MTSKIINFNKMTMNKRPTYETLVKDTILEPKDRIALPNRQATILRNTQKLSQFDDPAFLDLEETQQKIMTNQIQAQNVQQVISQSPPSSSAAIAQAMEPPQQQLRRVASTPLLPQTPFKQPQPFHPIPKGPAAPPQPLEQQQPSAPAALIADTAIEAEMAAASEEYSEQLKRAQELEEERKIKAAKSSTESLRKSTSLVQTIIQDFQQHMAAPKYPVLPPPKPHPYPATYSPGEEVQKIYRHPSKSASVLTAPKTAAPIEAASSSAPAAITPESSAAAASESSAAASSSSPSTRKKKQFLPDSESFKIPTPSKVSAEYAIDLLTYVVKNNLISDDKPEELNKDDILRLADEYKRSKRRNPAVKAQIIEMYKTYYQQLKPQLNR